MAASSRRRARGQDFGQLAAGIIAEETAEAGGARSADDVAAEALDVIPGLSGEDPSAASPKLGEILRRWGGAPLAALFALNLVDELDRAAFVILAPDLREAFDLSNAQLGAISGLAGVVLVTTAVPVGLLGDRSNRRTLIAGLGGLVWGIVVLLTSLVRNAGQLVLARVFTGLGQATVDPIHGSLIADYYPAEARGRVYGIHQAASPAANMLGPVLAGGVAAAAGGGAGWRWAFAVLAIPSVLAGLNALRLREPKRGGHERRTVLGVDNEPDAEPTEATAADGPTVPLATTMRRLNSIQTLRYLYAGIGVLGFALFAGPPLLSVYLEEHWDVSELGRGAIFSGISVGTAAGFLLGGVIGDRLFRRDPAWPLFLIGGGLTAYGIVFSAAVWLPALALVVAVVAVALLGVGAAVASLRLIVASVAPPAMRSVAFAMLGLYIALYGGFLGGVTFGSIADATNPRVALSFLFVPCAVAGVLIAFGARFVRDDIAMVVADLRQAERAEHEAQAAPASGAGRRRSSRRPRRNSLLEVRHLDFSYGPVQVLFDVSLEVREGELVALLGTNGAGKSTLLRAITGLDHPTRGTIVFGGRDVTYLEAEQLLSLGIAQMPGGRAVFPGLTVAENLRVGAFSFRKDARRVEQQIAQVEAWFPVLGQRRTQLAATLSGGEQQMLALAKAFLTRPRLFCIDELSLGLAPAVVSSLLDIVGQMHEQGTTILIVEQSLNVALTLATTAVFMEKGQVRFTGPAQELLRRPDLARSVFLEGAGR